VSNKDVNNRPSPTPPKITNGRDELNLAEFPLSAISTRTDPDKQKLVFEDTLWDSSQRKSVTRRLVISASTEYGLPTALDDEIVLGLIQLAKIQRFAERKVHFSRYQLIQILGWRDESKSYARIEESLKRWVGVTLHYDKAWWNKEEQCWVNETFHILDNISLLDKERRKTKKIHQEDLPFSYFTWNDIIFQSFRAGNLKSLDFEFYKKLNSAIAKRLYRFLDKRFYLRKKLSFNLKELAWEHLGLARSYDVANLKRKLLPAIKELESLNFLKQVTPSKRFRKFQVGTWEVDFEKANASEIPKAVGAQPERPDLLEGLIFRGVTESVAKELIATEEAIQIEEKIEVFDWLQSKEKTRVQNPGGFLVASIRKNYEAPKEYESPEEREMKEAATLEKQRKKAALRKQSDAKEAAKKEEALRKQPWIDNYWDALSEPEQNSLRDEVMDTMDDITKELVVGGSPLKETLIKAQISARIFKILKGGGAKT